MATVCFKFRYKKQIKITKSSTEDSESNQTLNSWPVDEDMYNFKIS